MARTRKRPHASSSNWVIAIPSYKRATVLRDKTLVALKHYRIPPSKIHVFVADKQEADTYKETLEPGSYGHLHIAVPGMAAVRNFITRHFPVGTPIFNIDDDIQGFIEFTTSKGYPRHERPLRSLSDTITRGFQECHRTGFRLFGFYPVANGYFMKEGPPTTDLRYIMGGAWGIVNPGPILTVTLDDKEDFLRSVLMYVLDGGVVRFGNIGVKTLAYKTSGGMQEERTMRRIEWSARQMVAMFPDLVKINLTKKSGMPEVRLRDSRPPEDREFGQAVLKRYLTAYRPTPTPTPTPTSTPTSK